MSVNKRKMGRPVTAAKLGQKATLGIRATADLKERLAAEATRNDRSLSQEAELRLERSFERQDLVTEVLEATYGRQLSAVLEMIGRVMRDTGRHVGFSATGTLEGSSNWLDDPYAFDQALRGAVKVLEALRPPGDPKPRSAMRPANESAARLMKSMESEWGESFAAGLLEAVGNPDRRGEIGDWTRGPRARLGTAAERLAKHAATGSKEKQR